jgi:hypothetical protein
MGSSGQLTSELTIAFISFLTAQSVLSQDKKLTKLLEAEDFEKAEAYCAKQ